MKAYLVKTFGEDMAAQIMQSSVHLLPLLGAIGALIVGWLLARFVAWLVFKALCKIFFLDRLNERKKLFLQGLDPAHCSVSKLLVDEGAQ